MICQRRAYLVFVCATLAIGTAGCPDNPPETTGPRPQEPGSQEPRPGEYESLRDGAYELMKQSKWCDAKAKWTEAQAAAKRSADSQQEIEAKANYDICERLCGQPPLTGPIIDTPDEEGRPEPVSRDRLIAMYPKGKVVRSLAILDATGRGTNRDWAVLKHQAHFLYEYQVAAETSVKSNDEYEIVFEKDFKEVKQIRALSDGTLEIAPPDDPLFDMTWKAIEEQLAVVYPKYRVIKEVVNIADPGLQRTLTRIAKGLGIPLRDIHVAEVVEKVEKLAGTRIRFVYQSGVGVTSVEPLNNRDRFPDKDELTRIAHNAGLLADLHLAEAAEKRPGEETILRIKDIASMLALPYDVTFNGRVTVKKEPNKPEEGQDLHTLSVPGGEMNVTANVDGNDREGVVRINSGTIHYSPNEKLVTKAEMSVDGTTSFVSRDHLLFGTTAIKSAKMRMWYQAKPVKNEAAVKNSDE